LLKIQLNEQGKEIAVNSVKSSYCRSEIYSEIILPLYQEANLNRSFYIIRFQPLETQLFLLPGKVEDRESRTENPDAFLEELLQERWQDVLLPKSQQQWKKVPKP